MLVLFKGRIYFVQLEPDASMTGAGTIQGWEEFKEIRLVFYTTMRHVGYKLAGTNFCVFGPFHKNIKQ